MAYSTTSLYQEAINKEARVTYIDGEIRGSNNVVIPISNDMISPGSLYVTNQCVNGDTFEYGSVFAAELGITLRTEIDRYTLYDAEVKLFFNLLLSNKSYERIPLGVFNINEPNRVGRNISIKAYDKMINLEEDIFESVTGTPFELLAYLSARCNVSLAQSKTEISLFVNSEVLLTVSPDRVGTYRELLSYICQVTCTFAAFDREGKLRLYEYATSPSKEIMAKSRTSSKFSDFETYFSGAKGELIHNDSYKSYMQANEGTGITYDMGSIPIVQGLDTTNHAVVANVALRTSSIRYTPCDISFTGDPAIDLGDMIVNVDRNGNKITSFVTFYKWAYRGAHQIKSAGQNPKLSKVKSKTDKEMSNLKNDISTKDVSVYTYTNASTVNIQGGESEDVTSMNSLAMISFSAKKAATCMVMVTIPIEMSTESDIEFHQLLDGVEMMGGLIAQRCHVGLSTVTFVNYFNTVSNSIHRYSIVGITKGVEGGEAGTLSIKPYSLKVIVFGQGLESVVQWDGNIIVNDIVPLIEVENVTLPINITDVVSTSKQPHNPHTVSDKVKKIAVGSQISVAGFLEDVAAEFDENDL